MTRVPSQALLGYKMFASWFNCSAGRADAGAGAELFSPVNEILVARSVAARLEIQWQATHCWYQAFGLSAVADVPPSKFPGANLQGGMCQLQNHCHHHQVSPIRRCRLCLLHPSIKTNPPLMSPPDLLVI